MQIYIHIPFCRAKCKYCAFNSIVADSNLIDDYVDALCIEIAKSPQIVDTIYFGGGTPSILNIRQLSKIFATLQNTYDLSKCREVTFEANPGTIDKDYLMKLRELGINRLSLGVQSFNDNLLRFLGRIHNQREALEIIEAASSTFDNVSIDLMYDLPKQNVGTLRQTLGTAVGLDVQHISIYGLEVEEQTEFGRLQSIGQLPLPTDEESDNMYELINEMLPQHGFKRYEISNFAKDGFESRHNLGYWSDVEYLGLGAGAHSYVLKRNSECGMRNLHGFKDEDFGFRFSNEANVEKYVTGTKSGLNIKKTEEVLTRQAAMEEFCFLALRKTEGISPNRFKIKFGVDIGSIYAEVIDKLKREGLLEVSDSSIKLTERGMKYGNRAFSEFLLSP